MTRENKLALVVGFALILVVGILISDHFSTARAQAFADLQAADDPLADSHPPEAPLLDLDRSNGEQPSADPAPLAAAQPETPVEQVAPARLHMPDLQREDPPPSPPSVEATTAANGGIRFHAVQPGESL
ncbi:MAG: hypothetical protein ACYSXF_04105, partial [Planctomycetota bacterium]